MPAHKVALSALLGVGVKYAPVAYQAFKHGRGPAQELVSRRLDRRTARNVALEHAEHLVEGSVLPVYDGDQRVWVVFSRDTVVGTHPVVRTPNEKLLAHADLSKRTRPADARPGRRARLGRGPQAREARRG